jgi:UDP-glucose-4-epimerase GalE
MRILVTGGAGYIGCHAARELARQGHEPVIYDNLSTGHRFLADGFEFIFGDISDRERLRSALNGVEGVMHFAAHSHVGESVRDPRRYFENNVRAGLNFLDSVMDEGIRTLIFSSSCSVYGIPPTVPIEEDAPRQPLSPYGASKLFFEHALEAYATSYGLRYVSLRYFNAAGADKGGDIGELHDPEPHLIPSALEAATGTRGELEIFGSDYPTPDGTCVRDYVHVSDLATGHALALSYLADGGESSVLNLGTGRGNSVLEIIAAVEEVTGKSVPRRFAGRRAGDPPVLIADPCRAERLLQWSASQDIKESVSSAWKWMQRQAGRHLGPRTQIARS